jgi:hypothetical protein
VSVDRAKIEFIWRELLGGGEFGIRRRFQSHAVGELYGYDSGHREEHFEGGATVVGSPELPRRRDRAAGLTETRCYLDAGHEDESQYAQTNRQLTVSTTGVSARSMGACVAGIHGAGRRRG